MNCFAMIVIHYTPQKLLENKTYVYYCAYCGLNTSTTIGT